MKIKTTLEERRSVNFFDTSKKIEKSTLSDIINLAVLAPSAFNLQPWRIIVAESTEAKQKLKTLSNDQPKVLEASACLILIGNKNGWDNTNPVWDEMLVSVGGNQEMVDGAKQAASYLYGSTEDNKLKFAESNVGLLAMSIMTAAKEFGVDTHPMSGINFEGVHKEFELQEQETVVMTICMGYFDQTKTLYPRRPRLGFDQIVTIL